MIPIMIHKNYDNTIITMMMIIIIKTISLDST